MWHVGGRKPKRKGLVYRLRLLIEETHYLGKKVLILRIQRLLASGTLLFIFFLVALFFSGIVGCGGPPQNTDVGEEGPATLSVESGGHFGEVITSITAQNMLTIFNSSFSVPATQIVLTSTPSAPFNFLGGAFPGTGGTCSETLAPLATCTLTFDITAITTGPFSSSGSLSYWDGLASQSLAFAITATARDPLPALLTFSPSGAHDYGTNAIGGTFDTTITITNSGESTATGISEGGLAAPFSLPGGGSCAATLAMNQSCTTVVRYTPVAQIVSNDTLEINYNDGSSNQMITKSLQGEGRIAANLVIDEGNTFNFSIVNNTYSIDQILTVRNTGGGNATGIALNGLSSPYTISSNTCPTILVPAASCLITLRFAPTTTGSFSSTPSIDYSDGFNAQVTNINLTGEGFANTLMLSLIAPISSPSTVSTPTLRVSNTVNNINIRLYSNSTCTNQVGLLIASTATLDFAPVMTEGTYEFHARAEDSVGNLSACSASLVNYEYDNTAPNPPSNVNLSSAITTSNTSSPNFTWATSPSSDVVNYEIGISTLATGGNNVAGWASIGIGTLASYNGLSLNECSYYYASVRAVDDVGLASPHVVSPTSFRYDSALPTTPSNLMVDSDATPTNSATIDWSASTDTCGVAYYEYAIGTAPGGSNTLSWTNIGTLTSYRQNGIALASSTNYYTSIRATDTTGRVSTIATSAAWIIFDPPAALPNMIAWLDGADRATLFDSAGRDAIDPLFNGTVENWIDKSGSTTDHDFNSHLTAPAYSQANFSLNFDGATTGMTTPNDNEINLQTVVQRNITIAFRTSADINTRQVLYEEGGNIRGMNMYIFNGDLYCGFYNVVASDGDGVQNFTWVTRALAPNTVYFATWVYDYTNYSGPSGADGSLDCYVNSALAGSVPTTSRLFGHSGAVGLGVVNNQTMIEDQSVVSSGANFLGDMYEVMLFNDAPDITDVTNVHTYLDNKWN